MKRIVCIILAVIFCLSFAACGKSGDTATEDSATKDSAVSSAASSAEDTAETERRKGDDVIGEDQDQEMMITREEVQRLLILL